MKKFYLLLLVVLSLSLLLTACVGSTGEIPTSTANTIPPQPVTTNPPDPITSVTTVTATTSEIAAPTETIEAVLPAQITKAIAINTPSPESVGPVVAPTATINSKPAIPTKQPPTASTAQATTSASNTTKAATTTKPASQPAPTTAKTTTAPATTAVPTATPVAAEPNPPYTGSLAEVFRGGIGKKKVAITLDAGAGSEPFPKMLAALGQNGVRITFFLTGQWAQQNPNYVQQIVAAGHEVANHSWSHPDFTTLSDDKMRDEIEKTEALLSRFTGHSTRPLFRPPYGSRTPHILQVVNGQGYRSVMWTLDSLDSVGQPKSAQFLIDRITKQTDAQLDGEIILMHIGNATTADALPAILQNLQRRGFQVVTVSELLK